MLVPDDTITIGGIYLSTYLVEVADGSDGRAEPGETTDLFVWLLNAGNQGLTGVGTNPVQGHLEVVPGDYDGDGTNDPILPVITQADSAYPDIEPAAEVTGDCDTVQDQLHPVRNLTAFRVHWPSSPTDVAYQFRVVVTGQPFGFTPVPTFPVPFVVGVGSACNVSNVTGEFDGLQGLLPPMGPLVPADNDTPIPATISTESPTRPLKLKLFCGSKQLTGKDNIAAPEIIRLVRDGADVDLTKLYLDVNSNANDHSLLFRYSSGGSAWIYNLNTNAIGSGAYTLYIKMPNGQPYKTSFSIR